MNITFLVGNGFDIGVGLHSRFADFFPIYQKQSTQKKKKIKQLSEEIRQDYETWADFESALGDYTEKFTLETKQDFLKQLKDFELSFADYLKRQEDQLLFDNKNDIAETMKKGLCHFYAEKVLPTGSSNAINRTFLNHKNENHRYNFVVFNYTTVLERCLEAIEDGIVNTRTTPAGERKDTIGATIHVHGRIGYQPIMGVNDVGQIKNKVLAEDKRFAQFMTKPLLNKANRTSNDADTTRIINESSIICVYGMSLGKTDKKWWNLILSWLRANSARQLVVFTCDKNYSTNDQFAWLDKENELIDKLAEYSGNVDVETLRPRIHLSVNCNIFEMRIDTYLTRTLKDVLMEETAIV